MAKNCKASGGTQFGQPLTYLKSKVDTKELLELQVIFLTDGADGSPSNTREVSRGLKHSILVNEVYSKFSVIGLTDAQPELLNEIIGIGSEVGTYMMVDSSQP